MISGNPQHSSFDNPRDALKVRTEYVNLAGSVGTPSPKAIMLITANPRGRPLCCGIRNLCFYLFFFLLSFPVFLIRQFPQEMLNRRRDGELLVAALNCQVAFLTGGSSEQVPCLPHGRPLNRNAVDCDEMIAGFDAAASLRYRRFAVEIRDAENGEVAVVFWTEGQADDIEVRKVEHAAELEVDLRMRVVESDSIVEQRT